MVNLDTLILPQVNSDCKQLLLDEAASRYSNDRMVLALDGAGWHRSHTLKLPHNLRLFEAATLLTRAQSCREYWDELREKSFHNRVSTA